MSEKHKYEYKSIDNSVLTPPFRKYIATPVLNWVPISVHPNLITVVSSIFSIVALGLSYKYGQGLVNNLVMATLVFMYLLSDHLDGMQAKRRGGGTALGEFLDHFLDVLNNGIFLLILVNIFQIQTPFIVLAMFGFGYVTQSAVFFEQYKTGWIVFGRFESFEAVIILILIIILSGITPIYDLVTELSFNGLRLVEWIFFITSTTGTAILLTISKRVGKGMVEFIVLIVSVGLMVLASYYLGFAFSQYTSISIAIILVTQEYMISRLTYRTNKWIVYVLPVFFILSITFGNYLFFDLTLALVCVVRFVNTVYVLTDK